MAKPKIQVVETGEVPICPYCEQELTTLNVNSKQRSLVEFQKVFFCPHCRKVLGLSSMRSVV